MTTLTPGNEVHHSHNLGRCYTCDLAFHWKRSDGVTCPKCGGGLSITTRRLRQGFLFLTPEDVKAIEDANGYSAIKPQIAKLNRRMTVLNREAERLWDAFRLAERKPAVTPEGREYFTFDEKLPAAVEAKAAYDAFQPQRDAVDQERRALWRQVKGVPVAVSGLEGERRMVTHNVTPQPSRISEEAQAFRQAAEERARARAAAAAVVVDAEAQAPAPAAEPAPEPEAKPNLGVIKGKPWAGEVKRAQSEAGTTVVLLDVRKGGEWAAQESDGGRWVTVCDQHGSVCQHRTRALAEHHLTGAEWCEECIAIMEAQAEAAAAPALIDVDDDLTLSYGGTMPAPEAKPKGTHGGARKGAGRKPVGADVKAVSVSLPAAMIESLKLLGSGNLSAGIRQMHRLMAGEAR